MNLSGKRAVLITAMAALCFLLQSCSDWFLEDPIYPSPAVEEVIQKDSTPSALTAEEYEKLCIRTEYYFCPGVSGPLMRIEITKDVCVDPPAVLSMSECKEYLECDPHYYNLGEKSCFTDDGLPGVRETYCVKGFIEEGPCEAQFTPDEDIHFHEEAYSEEVYECGPVDIDAGCEKEEVDILVIIDLSASMIPEIQSVYDAIDSFSSEHSDSDHVMWSLIVGPKNNGNKPGNHNFLYLASNLQSIDFFQSELDSILDYDMIGQYEMLYDALYLSLRNISAFLPYPEEDLLWPVWVGKVIDESVPPLEDFYVNWRENSKKVIIVFTDEPGQSFLMPESEVGKSYNTNNTITHDKLSKMLESTDNVRLFVFADSDTGSMDDWDSLSKSTNGASFDLSDDAGDTKSSIEAIIKEEVCY